MSYHLPGNTLKELNDMLQHFLYKNDCKRAYQVAIVAARHSSTADSNTRGRFSAAVDRFLNKCKR